MRWTEEKECGVKVVSVAMKSPASERLCSCSRHSDAGTVPPLAPIIAIIIQGQEGQASNRWLDAEVTPNTHTHPHTCVMKLQSFKRDPRDMGYILR